MKQTLRDSAALRWSALLLLALAMFCAYIFMDILSPIKDLMQSQRGWDSDAFGTMQGSETFLNVFVFFLIFAGIILDKMGVRFTALLSGAVMLVGACIKWYAISDSFIGATSASAASIKEHNGVSIRNRRLHSKDAGKRQCNEQYKMYYQ